MLTPCFPQHLPLLRDALDHFWAVHSLQIQQTRHDLDEKKKRFDAAYAGLEANWVGITPEQIACACVYARMCVSDFLDPWVQEPAPKLAPKPSFFREQTPSPPPRMPCCWIRLSLLIGELVQQVLSSGSCTS